MSPKSTTPRSRGGRPKGSRNRKKILQEIAFEQQTVRIKGETKRYTTLEMILLNLRNKAMPGTNLTLADELFRLLDTYLPEETAENLGVLVAPAEMSPEEWIREQEEKNKHRKPPESI